MNVGPKARMRKSYCDDDAVGVVGEGRERSKPKIIDHRINR
jgi:hypothetical protein